MDYILSNIVQFSLYFHYIYSTVNACFGEETVKRSRKVTVYSGICHTGSLFTIMLLDKVSMSIFIIVPV